MSPNFSIASMLYKRGYNGFPHMFPTQVGVFAVFAILILVVYGVHHTYLVLKFRLRHLSYLYHQLYQCLLYQYL